MDNKRELSGVVNLKSILWKVNGGVQRLDDKLEHIQFLTGNTLKVIAVLTMIVDHICKIVLQWLLTDGYWGVMLDSGKMSWEQYQQIDYFIRFDLQSIGTIAFPLFCFLLTEGFKHTIIAELFRCDYGLEGILLYIAAFYVCRKNRIYQVLLFLSAYMVATGNQPPLCTLLACVLILLYNGKRGKLRLKYFFYAFYPIHIIILYLIRLSLTNFS